MLVLGLDFETTGVDTKTARIIEAGAVLWETDSNQPLEMFNTLVFDPSYSPEDIKKSGDESHGIALAQLQVYGREPFGVLQTVQAMVEKAVYVVGHNVREYDWPLFRAELVRWDLPQYPENVPPLIDTMTDLPFSKFIKGRALEYLGAKHGFVNPFPHRAITDVLSTLKLLSCYPFEAVERYAKAATITLRAKVGYENRDQAKGRGYRWDGERKWWIKAVKDFQLDEELAGAPFEIVKVGAK